MKIAIKRQACAYSLMVSCLLAVTGCASVLEPERSANPASSRTTKASTQDSDGAELTAALGVLAREPVEAGQVAGLSVAVVQGTDTLLLADYGLADLELGAPMPDNAVHEIGSVTKQFTAAAILQLAEAGKLGLNDELTKHLPDFPTHGHRITIRHLLNHTSGIPDFSGLPTFRPLASQPIPYDEVGDTVVDLIAPELFDFPPGSRQIYNNSNSFLLGLVIEKVSGRSWEDYIEQEIFAALGMRRSHYCHFREVIEDRVHGYSTRPDGTFLRAAHLDHRWTYAAGSLCSSTGDLITWLRALHGGHVLGEAAYREMITPDTLEHGHPLRYAKNLAVMDDTSGHRWIGHGNNNPGFRSEVRYYPDHDLYVVVLMNTRGVPRPQEIASALALQVLGPATPTPTVEYRGDLDQLTGRYSGLARYGRTLAIEIERDGDGLTMRMNDDKSGKPLRYLGGGLWEACCYSPVGSEHLRFVVEPGSAHAASLYVDSSYEHPVLEREAAR